MYSLAVPDPGTSGHCPGKTLVNCAHCFVPKFSCNIGLPGSSETATAHSGWLHRNIVDPVSFILFITGRVLYYHWYNVWRNGQAW